MLVSSIILLELWFIGSSFSKRTCTKWTQSRNISFFHVRKGCNSQKHFLESPCPHPPTPLPQLLLGLSLLKHRFGHPPSAWSVSFSELFSSQFCLTRDPKTGACWEDREKGKNWKEKGRTFFSFQGQGKDWKYIEINIFASLDLHFLITKLATISFKRLSICPNPLGQSSY